MIKFFCFTPFDINRATLNAFDRFVNDEGMGGQACGYVIGAGDGVEANVVLMEKLWKDSARWNILTNTAGTKPLRSQSEHISLSRCRRSFIIYKNLPIKRFGNVTTSCGCI